MSNKTYGAWDLPQFLLKLKSFHIWFLIQKKEPSQKFAKLLTRVLAIADKKKFEINPKTIVSVKAQSCSALFH